MLVGAADAARGAAAALRVDEAAADLGEAALDVHVGTVVAVAAAGGRVEEAALLLARRGAAAAAHVGPEGGRDLVLAADHLASEAADLLAQGQVDDGARVAAAAGARGGDAGAQGLGGTGTRYHAGAAGAHPAAAGGRGHEAGDGRQRRARGTVAGGPGRREAGLEHDGAAAAGGPVAVVEVAGVGPGDRAVLHAGHDGVGVAPGLEDRHVVDLGGAAAGGGAGRARRAVVGEEVEHSGHSELLWLECGGKVGCGGWAGWGGVCNLLFWKVCDFNFFHFFIIAPSGP